MLQACLGTVVLVRYASARHAGRGRPKKRSRRRATAVCASSQGH